MPVRTRHANAVAQRVKGGAKRDAAALASIALFYARKPCFDISR